MQAWSDYARDGESRRLVTLMPTLNSTGTLSLQKEKIRMMPRKMPKGFSRKGIPPINLKKRT
jgi:hypothetical protein